MEKVSSVWGTLHFDGADSGSLSVITNSYLPGEIVAVLGNYNSLGRKGYSFFAWNTAVDGRGISYFPGSKISMSKDVSLYPQWSLIAVNQETATGTPETDTAGSVKTDTATSSAPVAAINANLKLIPDNFTFSQNLRPGSNGGEVIYLQHFLNAYNYTVNNPNGYFGAQTKAALIKFQKDKGFPKDLQTGNFYAKTREVVNALLK